MTTSLVSAALTPLVGLASAPILSHAVGPAGRGELAAATTPNVLIVSIAALGLMDALTFITSSRPETARRAILVASVAAGGAGVVSVLVLLPFLPLLAGRDAALTKLMLLAGVLAIPQLWVALLRAAAVGLQLWHRVAIEKALSAIVRLAFLAVLAATGHLTVLLAVLVLTVVPVAVGLIYLHLLFKRHGKPTRLEPGFVRPLFSYGFRSWFGSIAGILLAKLGLLLFTPLSNSTELGLYVVGVTVADVPLLLAFAMKDALFGVNARSRDAEEFAKVCRLSIFVATLGSLALGLSLPFWIGFVFGGDFTAAIPSALLQLTCTLFNVPTFILAAGSGAWGRPGLRSVGLLLALVVDVVAFVSLVPAYGAVGAALANLLSATIGAIFAVAVTSRVMGVSAKRLLITTTDDLWSVGRVFKRT